MQDRKKQTKARGSRQLVDCAREIKSVCYPFSVSEMLLNFEVIEYFNLDNDQDIPPFDSWPDHLKKKYKGLQND